MTKTKKIRFVILSITLLFSLPIFATEVDSSIASCLKAWGKHPFGKNPKYKTLSTSVKVFGIGEDTKDSEITNSPSLVLINPGVNVMGGSTIELLNPNGWYCFRTNVNVMGGLNIKLHCKAHLASSTGGTTVLGSDSDKNSVTVMGSTEIEHIDCD